MMPLFDATIFDPDIFDTGQGGSGFIDTYEGTGSLTPTIEGMGSTDTIDDING